MNKLFSILLAALVCIPAFAAVEPDIRLTTNIYETDGTENEFTLILGAVPGTEGKATVVCSGSNPAEVDLISAYFDSSLGTLMATNITCHVDAQGYVEVFLDEGVEVDYIYCEGGEITSLDVKHPENISILSLEHNSLEQLDLTDYTNLGALYLKDNPFNKKPLVVGPNKPNLVLMDLSIIDNVDINFDLTTYPNLVSFVAYSTPSIVHLNPSACTYLEQLSIDNTSVSGLDLRGNTALRVLNISETRIENIDLSPCVNLEEFYCTHMSWFNNDIKLKKVDVTGCPNLKVLALHYNELTSIDLTKCPLLTDIYLHNNHLTNIDLSNNPNLVNVYLHNNDMDFSTLPIPQETWSDFYLNQRPITVPSSYLVGSQLNLASRVLREGETTYAAVLFEDEREPGLMVEVDPEYYTYENGVITINEVIEDSVLVSFYNPLFPYSELNTTKFLIKDDSSFDKPTLVASLGDGRSAGAEVKFSVGLANAKPTDERNFFVDLGDGKLKQFHATSSSTPAAPNVVAQKTGDGPVQVYMPDGEFMSALKIENISLSSLDLTPALQLTELTLTNTNLKELDLKWNRLLESVDITGNDFGGGFTLEGANGGYGKNMLSHINLSNNNMSSVKLNEPGSWDYIDLSHNRLTYVNFTDADYVTYLDLSHNDFESVSINYLGILKTFYCNDNHLTELVLPETNVIEMFNCANNNFTFANMPNRANLDEAHFVYAPQADIQVPAKASGCDLKSQNVSLFGKQTVFTWKTAGGETLTRDVDYTIANGVTTFDNSIEGKTVYCEITHDSFPALSGANALKTTPIQVVGIPSHLVGEFTTTTSGQSVRLALASAVPNNSVYIDWKGDGTLTQYPLATTYTVFNETTKAGARVKVWSYDEDDNLTVFSISGAKLSDVDLSPMKSLTSLTLSESGISDMVWPESPNLKELSLNNCTFSDFDFSRYPELTFVNFDKNKFTTIDISGLTKLGSAGFVGNEITTVKLGDNNALWQLALTNNKIETIDLSGAPNIEQLFLNNNNLSQIDLSGLSSLRVVYLDYNKFDFTTLPVPDPQWTLYTYGNQPALNITCVDGSVDLSSQLVRDGVETQYNWFYDAPVYDAESGTLTGELLVEGVDYIIKNGVTYFLDDIDKVSCVLMNELFPRTYLKTNVIAVTKCLDGIADVNADKFSVKVDGRTINILGAADGSQITVFTATGATVGKATVANGVASVTVNTAGTYIVAGNGSKAKVLVK